MFIERLPKNVQNNLALLGKSPIKDIFYLAGGTACALWLGHRISVDLEVGNFERILSFYNQKYGKLGGKKFIF